MSYHTHPNTHNTHPGALDVRATSEGRATSAVEVIPVCHKCGHEMIRASHSIPPHQWICLCWLGRIEDV